MCFYKMKFVFIKILVMFVYIKINKDKIQIVVCKKIREKRISYIDFDFLD